jgi:hypothetical protein
MHLQRSALYQHVHTAKAFLPQHGEHLANLHYSIHWTQHGAGFTASPTHFRESQSWLQPSGLGYTEGQVQERTHLE